MTPAEEAEVLKQATREAHEAMKDMKVLMKQMEVIREDLKQVATEVFEERMQEQVAKGLDDYKDSLDRHIDDATAAVYRRFDTLSDILLGKKTDLDIEQAIIAGDIRR